MVEKNGQKHSALISVILVIGITIIALIIGWAIKSGVENQTSIISRNSITAEVPEGWLTQYGIEGEGMIFSASDPFNANHTYSVTQLPVVPGGQLTDSVVYRNLQRAQELANYQVLDQSAVKLSNSEGYRVTYAYVDTPKFSKIPIVMMGVDFYQLSPNRVVVISLEDQSTKYDEVYPAFIKFLNSVKISSGG